MRESIGRIEIDQDLVPTLRESAVRDHRSLREQGGYLLSLKLREILAALDKPEAVEAA